VKLILAGWSDRQTEGGSLAKFSSNSAALARGDNYDSERVNSTSGETPWTVATHETKG